MLNLIATGSGRIACCYPALAKAALAAVLENAGVSEAEAIARANVVIIGDWSGTIVGRVPSQWLIYIRTG